MKFLTYNFKYILLAVALVIIFLMWKGCGDGAATEKQAKEAAMWKSKNDSLQMDLAAIEHDNLRLETALDRNEEENKFLLQDNARIRQQLQVAISYNSKSARKVITAKVNKDTAGYKQGCEELVQHSIELERLLLEKDESESAIRQNYIDQLADKDHIIDNLHTEIKALKSLVDYGNTIISNPGAAYKPRAQVFAGGSVIGNKGDIFSGYGAGLSLLNKKGLIYEVSSKWINGVQYFEGGVKLRLSFRKH